MERGRHLYAPPSEKRLAPATVAGSITALAGVLLTAVGLTVLCGWLFDVQALREVLPTGVVIIPMTAVGLLAGGVALWSNRNAHETSLPLTRFLGAFIVLLGTITVIEHMSGWNTGIDLALFGDRVKEYAYFPPGRMASNTGLSFALAGLGILALGARVKGIQTAGQIAAGLGFAVAALALIGHLFGATPLYTIDKAAGMALVTALGLATLNMGILFAPPHRGMAALVAGSDPGGALIRRLLPAAVTTVLVLGWLLIRARDGGWVSREGGTALFCLLVVVTITGLVVRSALLLRRADEERANHFNREVLARESAERADGAKTDFLATMSHELRTPLNAIVGYTSLLKDGVPGPINDVQARMLDRVTISSRHLLSLIEDVLRLSRMELNKEPVSRERTNAALVTRDAEAIIEPLAHVKGLTFDVTSSAADLVLVTDPSRLRQILINLLGNAVKFTPAGTVSLDTSDDAGNVTFVVRDTGIGIAPENLTRVFDAFWQVDQSRNRSVEGAGLGLALSRRLTELLGGQISLTSELGVGTTVRVVLPRHGGSAVADGGDIGSDNVH